MLRTVKSELNPVAFLSFLASRKHTCSMRCVILLCFLHLTGWTVDRKITSIRPAVKPKQIQIFPKDLVFDGEREILERAVILNWMKQWLTWLSWYHTVALSPDVTIDQLFDVPMCATSWKRSNEDYELIKFSFRGGIEAKKFVHATTIYMEGQFC
ncbi:hypothetical protein KY290_005111 [Solanum tuberosum]|uniref:Uncharacterized protein n=1 Tax=Solanum tuberosum TaxID=4113 RepID=A0ABQ7WD57_SOLTU|nr:hypothetical protein KY284_005233 [Solanum tuberosum]KAH0722460.1 hypothetical protein KY289_005504 [Solanum tuberosum]KAH0751852.1 hypothetical protein KY285_005000 [Solanum tuberosum]KAH0778684.1 hypothetical protein KY290_005111 [Solanum tuberosum]